MRRCFSCFLAGIYFVTQVALAHAGEGAFWDERRRAARQAAASPSQTLLAQVPAPAPWRLESPDARTFLPAGAEAAPAPLRRALAAAAPFAAVREFHAPSRAGAPVVVLIQDLHGAAEAQKNVAALLARWSADGPVWVGLEGASGAFEPAPFRELAGPAARRLLADYFLGLDVLGGAEAAALAEDNPPVLWGAETPDLYQADVRALREGLKERPRARAAFAPLLASLSFLKDRLYSPELKTFDAAFRAHAAGGDLGPYVRTLLSLAPAEAAKAPNLSRFVRALAEEDALDFRAVEAERARLIERLAGRLAPADLQRLAAAGLSLREGSLPPSEFYALLRALCRDNGVDLAAFPVFRGYMAYAAEAEGIARTPLLAELSAVERAVPDALARTPGERELAALSRDAALTDRLIRHEMTPEDWAAYENRRADILNFPQRLRSLSPASAVGDGSPGLETLLRPFEDFCRAAVRRDSALADNAWARLPKDGVVAMVAGGFHTDGLSRLLREKGSGVAVLTPRLSRLPDTSYADVFDRDPIPLEKVFAGRTVNLLRERSSFNAGVSPEALPRQIAFVRVFVVLAALLRAALEKLTALPGSLRDAALRLPFVRSFRADIRSENGEVDGEIQMEGEGTPGRFSASVAENAAADAGADEVVKLDRFTFSFRGRGAPGRLEKFLSRFQSPVVWMTTPDGTRFPAGLRWFMSQADAEAAGGGAGKAEDLSIEALRALDPGLASARFSLARARLASALKKAASLGGASPWAMSWDEAMRERWSPDEVEKAMRALDASAGSPVREGPASFPLSGDRYEIQGGVIGSGGFVDVYRAVDRSTGREVALRVLQDAWGDKMFRREYIVHRELQEASDAVPKAFAYGFLSKEKGALAGRAFIAMEYMPGGALSAALRSGEQPRPMAAGAAGEAMKSLLKDLGDIHDRGWLLRDIKPSNILMDAAGRPRFSDVMFAVKKIPVEEETGMVFEYKAPETLAHKTFNRKTDLYSLGITFREMLTGERNFTSFDGVPASLVRFIHELTHPLPDGRPYATAEEALAALERAWPSSPLPGLLDENAAGAPKNAPAAEGLPFTVRWGEKEYISLEELKAAEGLDEKQESLLLEAAAAVRKGLAEFPADVRTAVENSRRTRFPPYMHEIGASEELPVIARFAEDRRLLLDGPAFLREVVLARRGRFLPDYLRFLSELVIHSDGHVADENGGVAAGPALTGWADLRQALISGHGLDEADARTLDSIEGDLRADLFRLSLPRGRRDPGALSRVHVLKWLFKPGPFPAGTPKNILLDLARHILLSELEEDPAQTKALWEMKAPRPGTPERALVEEALAYLKAYWGGHSYDPSWTERATAASSVQIPGPGPNAAFGDMTDAEANAVIGRHPEKIKRSALEESLKARLREVPWEGWIRQISTVHPVAAQLRDPAGIRDLIERLEIFSVATPWGVFVKDGKVAAEHYGFGGEARGHAGRSIYLAAGPDGKSIFHEDQSLQIAAHGLIHLYFKERGLEHDSLAVHRFAQALDQRVSRVFSTAPAGADEALENVRKKISSEEFLLEKSRAAAEAVRTLDSRPGKEALDRAREALEAVEDLGICSPDAYSWLLILRGKDPGRESLAAARRPLNEPVPHMDGPASPPPAWAGIGVAADLSRYKIESKSGVGGFSQVFKARDTATGRTVAIKFLDKPEAADIFIRSYLHQRRLQDLFPGDFVPAYGIGRDRTGRYFVVMKWMEGGTMRDRLRSRPTAFQAYRLARRLGTILARMHAAGLLHNDFKPENIFFASTNLESAVLGDFDLACTMGVGRKETRILGAPAYIPLKTLARGGMDAGTDLYALGTVMYEAIARELPYPGIEYDKDPHSIIVRKEAPPPDIQQRILPEPALPEPFAYWIMGLLWGTYESRGGVSPDDASQADLEAMSEEMARADAQERAGKMASVSGGSRKGSAMTLPGTYKVGKRILRLLGNPAPTERDVELLVAPWYEFFRTFDPRFAFQHDNKPGQLGKRVLGHLAIWVMMALPLVLPLIFPSLAHYTGWAARIALAAGLNVLAHFGYNRLVPSAPLTAEDKETAKRAAIDRIRGAYREMKPGEERDLGDLNGLAYLKAGKLLQTFPTPAGPVGEMWAFGAGIRLTSARLILKRMEDGGWEWTFRYVREDTTAGEAKAYWDAERSRMETSQQRLIRRMEEAYRTAKDGEDQDLGDINELVNLEAGQILKVFPTPTGNLMKALSFGAGEDLRSVALTLKRVDGGWEWDFRFTKKEGTSGRAAMRWDAERGEMVGPRQDLIRRLEGAYRTMKTGEERDFEDVTGLVYLKNGTLQDTFPTPAGPAKDRRRSIGIAGNLRSVRLLLNRREDGWTWTFRSVQEDGTAGETEVYWDANRGEMETPKQRTARHIEEAYGDMKPGEERDLGDVSGLINLVQGQFLGAFPAPAGFQPKTWPFGAGYQLASVALTLKRLDRDWEWTFHYVKEDKTSGEVKVYWDDEGRRMETPQQRLMRRLEEAYRTMKVGEERDMGELGGLVAKSSGQLIKSFPTPAGPLGAQWSFGAGTELDSVGLTLKRLQDGWEWAFRYVKSDKMVGEAKVYWDADRKRMETPPQRLFRRLEEAYRTMELGESRDIGDVSIVVMLNVGQLLRSFPTPGGPVEKAQAIGSGTNLKAVGLTLKRAADGWKWVFGYVKEDGSTGESELSWNAERQEMETPQQKVIHRIEDAYRTMSAGEERDLGDMSELTQMSVGRLSQLFPTPAGRMVARWGMGGALDSVILSLKRKGTEDWEWIFRYVKKDGTRGEAPIYWNAERKEMETSDERVIRRLKDAYLTMQAGQERDLGDVGELVGLGQGVLLWTFPTPAGPLKKYFFFGAGTTLASVGLVLKRGEGAGWDYQFKYVKARSNVTGVARVTWDGKELRRLENGSTMEAAAPRNFTAENASGSALVPATVEASAPVPETKEPEIPAERAKRLLTEAEQERLKWAQASNIRNRGEYSRFLEESGLVERNRILSSNGEGISYHAHRRAAERMFEALGLERRISGSRDWRLLNPGSGGASTLAAVLRRWPGMDGEAWLRLTHMRMTEVDLSEGMLKAGRSVRLVLGERFPVEALAGDMAALPVRSGSFDVVFSGFVLNQIPNGDRVKALREAYRAAAPGGLVVLVEPAGTFRPEILDRGTAEEPEVLVRPKEGDAADLVILKKTSEDWGEEAVRSALADRAPPVDGNGEGAARGDSAPAAEDRYARMPRLGTGWTGQAGWLEALKTRGPADRKYDKWVQEQLSGLLEVLPKDLKEKGVSPEKLKAWYRSRPLTLLDREMLEEFRSRLGLFSGAVEGAVSDGGSFSLVDPGSRRRAVGLAAFAADLAEAVQEILSPSGPALSLPGTYKAGKRILRLLGNPAPTERDVELLVAPWYEFFRTFDPRFAFQHDNKPGQLGKRVLGHLAIWVMMALPLVLTLIFPSLAHYTGWAARIALAAGLNVLAHFGYNRLVPSAPLTVKTQEPSAEQQARWLDRLAALLTNQRLGTAADARALLPVIIRSALLKGLDGDLDKFLVEAGWPGTAANDWLRRRADDPFLFGLEDAVGRELGLALEVRPSQGPAPRAEMSSDGKSLVLRAGAPPARDREWQAAVVASIARAYTTGLTGKDVPVSPLGRQQGIDEYAAFVFRTARFLSSKGGTAESPSMAWEAFSAAWRGEVPPEVKHEFDALVSVMGRKGDRSSELVLTEIAPLAARFMGPIKGGHYVREAFKRARQSNNAGRSLLQAVLMVCSAGDLLPGDRVPLVRLRALARQEKIRSKGEWRLEPALELLDLPEWAFSEALSMDRSGVLEDDYFRTIAPVLARFAKSRDSYRTMASGVLGRVRRLVAGGAYTGTLYQALKETVQDPSAAESSTAFERILDERFAALGGRMPSAPLSLEDLRPSPLGVDEEEDIGDGVALIVSANRRTLLADKPEELIRMGAVRRLDDGSEVSTLEGVADKHGRIFALGEIQEKFIAGFYYRFTLKVSRRERYGGLEVWYRLSAPEFELEPPEIVRDVLERSVDAWSGYDGPREALSAYGPGLFLRHFWGKHLINLRMMERDVLEAFLAAAVRREDVRATVREFWRLEEQGGPAGLLDAVLERLARALPPAYIGEKLTAAALKGLYKLVDETSPAVRRVAEGFEGAGLRVSFIRMEGGPALRAGIFEIPFRGDRKPALVVYFRPDDAAFQGLDEEGRAEVLARAAAKGYAESLGFPDWAADRAGLGLRQGALPRPAGEGLDLYARRLFEKARGPRPLKRPSPSSMTTMPAPRPSPLPTRPPPGSTATLRPVATPELSSQGTPIALPDISVPHGPSRGDFLLSMRAREPGAARAITLPAPAPPPNLFPSPGSGEPLRVLMAEDDLDLQDLLPEFLRNVFTDLGYPETQVDIRVVSNGQKAEAALEEFKPHLLMTDQQMGGHNGDALIRAFRARFPGVPVIWCTSESFLNDRPVPDLAREWDVFHLPKPLPENGSALVKKFLSGFILGGGLSGREPVSSRGRGFLKNFLAHALETAVQAGLLSREAASEPLHVWASRHLALETGHLWFRRLLLALGVTAEPYSMGEGAVEKAFNAWGVPVKLWLKTGDFMDRDEVRDASVSFLEPNAQGKLVLHVYMGPKEWKEMMGSENPGFALAGMLGHEWIEAVLGLSHDDTVKIVDAVGGRRPGEFLGDHVGRLLEAAGNAAWMNISPSPVPPPGHAYKLGRWAARHAAVLRRVFGASKKGSPYLPMLESVRASLGKAGPGARREDVFKALDALSLLAKAQEAPPGPGADEYFRARLQQAMEELVDLLNEDLGGEVLWRDNLFDGRTVTRVKTFGFRSSSGRLIVAPRVVSDDRSSLAALQAARRALYRAFDMGEPQRRFRELRQRRDAAQAEVLREQAADLAAAVDLMPGNGGMKRKLRALLSKDGAGMEDLLDALDLLSLEITPFKRKSVPQWQREMADRIVVAVELVFDGDVYWRENLEGRMSHKIPRGILTAGLEAAAPFLIQRVTRSGFQPRRPEVGDVQRKAEAIPSDSYLADVLKGLSNLLLGKNGFFYRRADTVMDEGSGKIVWQEGVFFPGWETLTPQGLREGVDEGRFSKQWLSVTVPWIKGPRNLMSSSLVAAAALVFGGFWPVLAVLLAGLAALRLSSRRAWTRPSPARREAEALLDEALPKGKSLRFRLDRLFPGASFRRDEAPARGFASLEGKREGFLARALALLAAVRVDRLISRGGAPGGRLVLNGAELFRPESGLKGRALAAVVAAAGRRSEVAEIVLAVRDPGILPRDVSTLFPGVTAKVSVLWASRVASEDAAPDGAPKLSARRTREALGLAASEVLTIHSLSAEDVAEDAGPLALVVGLGDLVHAVERVWKELQSFRQASLSA